MTAFMESQKPAVFTKSNNEGVNRWAFNHFFIMHFNDFFIREVSRNIAFLAVLIAKHIDQALSKDRCWILVFTTSHIKTFLSLTHYVLQRFK
jgi:hypothetical protein